MSWKYEPCFGSIENGQYRESGWCAGYVYNEDGCKICDGISHDDIGRIIAAAPDLLHALETLLEEVNNRCGGKVEGNSMLAGASFNAEIAIANAKGEVE